MLINFYWWRLLSWAPLYQYNLNEKSLKQILFIKFEKIPDIQIPEMLKYYNEIEEFK